MANRGARAAATDSGDWTAQYPFARRRYTSHCAIRQGLAGSRFVEGQNIAFDYRWAEGQYDRLAALATDLVHRQVAAIITMGGELSALAAKAATSTIPIVFAVGTDPIRSGLAASLRRPDGNLTPHLCGLQCRQCD